MDDIKNTQPNQPAPATDDQNPMVQEALAKLQANTEKAQATLAKLKAMGDEQTKKLDDYEANILQTAQNMKTAFNELDADEAQAADELDALNLQFAEDMAKLDKEDEADEKAEEEEDEKEETEQ